MIMVYKSYKFHNLSYFGFKITYKIINCQLLSFIFNMI